MVDHGILMGGKEAEADAGDYQVRMTLTPQARQTLCIGDRKCIYIRFDNANDAHQFYTIARSRTTSLEVPWGDGKKAILQPAAWRAVTFMSPQQIIATPEPASIKGN